MWVLVSFWAYNYLIWISGDIFFSCCVLKFQNFWKKARKTNKPAGGCCWDPDGAGAWSGGGGGACCWGIIWGSMKGKGPGKAPGIKAGPTT